MLANPGPLVLAETGTEAVGAGGAGTGEAGWAGPATAALVAEVSGGRGAPVCAPGAAGTVLGAGEPPGCRQGVLTAAPPAVQGPEPPKWWEPGRCPRLAHCWELTAAPGVQR